MLLCSEHGLVKWLMEKTLKHHANAGLLVVVAELNVVIQYDKLWGGHGVQIYCIQVCRAHL